jgi:phosphocarrier protein
MSAPPALASTAPFVEKELVVLNEFGLYTRLATDFAQCASRFRSTIHLRVGRQRFPAKRAIDVLFANLTCGATFVLEAEGPDAALAAETLERLLSSFAGQNQDVPESVPSGLQQRRGLLFD